MRLFLLLKTLLGASMAIVRFKGVPLPCGPFGGCVYALLHSPTVLGIHLTDYACAFAVLCCATFAVAILGEGQAKQLLIWLRSLGFAAAFASNDYNYVVEKEVCVYCALYGCAAFFELLPAPKALKLSRNICRLWR